MCVCAFLFTATTTTSVVSVIEIILGNKIDVPRAISEDELRQFFGLHGLTTGKVFESRCFWYQKLILCWFLGQRTS